MKTKYIIGNATNGLVLYGTHHGYLFLNPAIADYKPVYFNSKLEADTEAQRLALYYPPGTTDFRAAKVFIFDEPKIVLELPKRNQATTLVLKPLEMTEMEINEALSIFDTNERLINLPVCKN